MRIFRASTLREMVAVMSLLRLLAVQMTKGREVMSILRFLEVLRTNG
jgi:hypothetical protein